MLWFPPCGVAVELVGKKEGAALKRQQVTQPVPSGHSFKHNNEVKISTVRRRARTKSLKVCASRSLYLGVPLSWVVFGCRKAQGVQAWCSFLQAFIQSCRAPSIILL